MFYRVQDTTSLLLRSQCFIRCCCWCFGKTFFLQIFKSDTCSCCCFTCTTISQSRDFNLRHRIVAVWPNLKKLTGKKSAPLPWYVWWPKLTALSCLFVYLSTVFVLSIKRIKLVKRFLKFYFICLHIICSKGPDWSKRDQPSPVLNILPNR